MFPEQSPWGLVLRPSFPGESACTAVEAELASLGPSVLLPSEALSSLGQGRQKALSPQRQLSNKGWAPRRLHIEERLSDTVHVAPQRGPWHPA